MTLTSSGRVLSGRTRRWEHREEDMKAGDRRSSSKHIKKHGMLFTIPRGRNGTGDSVIGKLLRWSHQEAHQAMLPKVNTGHAKGVRDQKHSNLVADNSSLSGGREPSSQNQILTPFRPRLQPFSFFACLTPPSGHWIPFWRDSSIFWVSVTLKYCLFSYFIKRLVFELDYSPSSSDSNMLV